MREENIKQLIKALGGYHYEKRDNYLNFSCPFAFWTHKKGTDNTPSSGIRINEDGDSFFKCWSCDKVFPLSQMIMELQYLMGKNPSAVPIDFKQCWAILAEEDSEIQVPSFTPVDYENLPEKSKLVVFPELWLGSFVNIKEHWYFDTRQVSKALVEKYRFVYDLTDMRVCLPIRNEGGELIGLQGRSVKKSPALRYRYYTYQGRSNNRVMGAENYVDIDKPLIVCEGFFDMLRIASVYDNVVFSLTSALSKHKLERIEDAGQVISFYDWGTGGDTARKKLKKYFGKRLIKDIIPSEEMGDPGGMEKDLIWSELNSIIPWLLRNQGDYV